MHRPTLLAMLALTGALVSSSAPSLAQESTTTSSSSTSSTTSSTSTTLPPDSEAGHAGGDEAVAPEDVPRDPVVVPPPSTPIPPSPVTAVVTRVVRARLLKARTSLAQARAARAAADSLVAREEAHLADLEARLAGLRSEERRAIARLKRAKVRLRQRATLAYMSGGIPSPSGDVGNPAARDAGRRQGYVAAVSTNDRRLVQEYAAARRNLTGDIAELAGAVELAQAALDGARQTGAAAVDLESQKDTELKMLQAGGAIAIGGFVFPVGDPHTFGSSFGAPRMLGTQYEHFHQGNDIFAPSGTPLLACERGVIVKVGTDVLGGTKLWIAGQSGTRYYYAHMSGYAPGIVAGSVVEAGAVVGFVGNTGNARGTPPHLHFEIHPDGGPAIDPYPILRTVDDATRAVRRRGG